MKKSREYSFFSSVLFRTPLYPYDFRFNKDHLEEIFLEGLFIASPDLFQEVVKNKTGDKIDISLEKYCSRARTRPTPFGLFAGCSIGHINGTRTHVQLVPVNNYQRITRLDMLCIYELIQYIEKQENILFQLIFYPNNSLYEIENEYRYIEYFNYNKKRIHQIVSVGKEKYISLVLDHSKSGMSFSELVQVVAKEGFSWKESIEFIKDMISSQLIRSELDISVTGDDPLDVLKNKLLKIKEAARFVSIIDEIRVLLEKIDSTKECNRLTYYKEIKDIIEKITPDFTPKYLFQTDLFKPTIEAKISNSITEEIYTIISFLNKLTPLPAKNNITEFIAKFSERYFDQEMDLNFVLDTEIGIGYPVNHNINDSSLLIDDIYFPLIKKGELYEYTALEKVLVNKYQNALQNGYNVIKLDEDDFPDFKIDWNSMPDTFSVICSIISDTENNKQVLIKAIGGHSAGYLLGRFGHLDSNIKSLLMEIAEKEKVLNPGMIFAEIIHLPETRTGNVIFRPTIREYEIPYLANPSVNRKCQVPLSDITISIVNGEIILKSKSLKKRIIPRLTNAHNYSYNSMPIYYFLCDLQSQNKKTILYLEIENYFKDYLYFPRVMYKNHILFREKWIIKSQKLKHMMHLSDEELLDNIRVFRTENRLPQCIIIQEGDNELFIDLENLISIKTMLSLGKNRNELRFEEFVFSPKDAVIEAKNGCFTNEFVFTLYRS